MSDQQIMFLAHFSNTPIGHWLDEDISDIVYWYNHSIKVHNQLNKAPD